jgi:hypothetical protein
MLMFDRKPRPSAAHAPAPTPAPQPPVVHDVLRSPGQPLDAATRAFMEPRFGHDFSRVRVHADARAAASARAVNAHAYTYGRDIVFDTGRYAPGSAAGQHLLAHELTHVLQQRNGSADPTRVEPAGSAAEHEARTAASRAMSGQPVPGLHAAPAGLARDVGFTRRGPISDPYGMGYNTVYQNAGEKSLPAVQDLAGCEGKGMTFDKAKFDALPAERREAVRALRPHAAETPCESWFVMMGTEPSPAPSTPVQAPPAPVNPYQPIIDKAIKGPADVDGEKAWLLDGTYWLDLLKTLPDNKRNLGGIPIGDLKGWLNVKGKPVVVSKFGSKADGPNNTGMITYKGNYLLWRHAIHHNHDPQGKGPATGTYDALEGYKLPADIVAQYEARKKAQADKASKRQ